MGQAGQRSLILWRVLSAVLLLTMGGIHLFLVLTGVGGLLGVLFVLNAIGGVVLAIAMIAAPRRFLPLASVLGLLFMAGTLLALVLALTVGLFGIREQLGSVAGPDDAHRRVDRHHRARGDNRPSVPDAASDRCFQLRIGAWTLRPGRSLKLLPSGQSTSVPGPVRKMLGAEAAQEKLRAAGDDESQARERRRRFIP